MARPIWTTQAGDLGVIAEREFYNFPLDAYDPDGGPVSFKLVSGVMPRGLVVKSNGSLQGIPSADQSFIRGVASDVRQDTLSKFSVRCTTQSGHISDRTFSITVTGQDIPQITSLTNDLGQVYDGAYYEYQLSARDLDNDALQWGVKSGALPPGITLDPTTGKLSGFAEPQSLASTAVIPQTTTGVSATRRYTFDIGVTDGKDYSLMSYSVLVIGNSSAGTDLTDNISPMSLTIARKRPPVMMTPQQDIGQVLHDNYFSFKFDGYDFDGDEFRYALATSDLVTGFDSSSELYDKARFDLTPLRLPPGVILDEETGWVHGYIPPQEVLDDVYVTKVLAYKTTDNTITSVPTYIKFTVVGAISSYLTWDSPALLGTIQNGSLSELKVSATATKGNVLHYKLRDDFKGGTPEIAKYTFVSNGSTPSFDLGFTIGKKDIWVYVNDKPVHPKDYKIVGSSVVFPKAWPYGYGVRVKANLGYVTSYGTSLTTGRLPQGLRLLDNGLIAGKASFNGFAIDGGATTFDTRSRTYGTSVITTFDTIYRFTVEVFDDEGEIQTTKNFMISVDLSQKIPFDNLYGAALLPLHQRAQLKEILNNQNLIPDRALYRNGDPNFGKAKDLRLLLASGLDPKGAAEFQAAIATNHYKKRVLLGDLKTARATGEHGVVDYEVVYIEVIDPLENKKGKSIPQTIKLRNELKIGNDQSRYITPNSFTNMRKVINDAIGQVDKIALPRWMLSKQENDSVLGFINAVVVCYTKPGESKKIAFNLSRITGVKFNDFDFELDRYIWDNSQSKYYDPVHRTFAVAPETTFDRMGTEVASFEFAARVDIATTAAFSQINWGMLSDLTAAGVFDGLTTDLNNKTLIFAKQENYSVTTEYVTGWENYKSPWENGGFDTGTYDEFDYVAGYGSINNQRSGVYKININDDGIVQLEFVQPVAAGKRVDIRSGGTMFGDKQLFYDITAKLGQSDPDYTPITDFVIGLPTSFDGKGTRFFSNKDVYTKPDTGDKYIMFPKIGVF
ncbi:hypothetical protein UFOVP116_339 [uncultured Caudovirales phage]|uniref:Ig n=1 Tax=uncultured Caudovirales phage TaxID=2100421 RepID=A0A6J5LF36_9CAUD|nr:hypothetical protein UFOVP116_339 [uncultured Caudovirales phage]